MATCGIVSFSSTLQALSGVLYIVRSVTNSAVVCELQKLKDMRLKRWDQTTRAAQVVAKTLWIISTGFILYTFTSSFTVFTILQIFQQTVQQDEGINMQCMFTL